jgi:2-iminobutanoate/2-iminopropanoate deaminase
MRMALALLFAASTLVACGGGGGVTSSETDRSAPASEVFGQDDDRGYSMAATYGNLVWTAGHLPEAASPRDDIESQTKVVMEDLEATLEEAGSGLDTVVMTNVYLSDFDDWPAFNETYKRYFEGSLPPRVTVEVSSLAFGYDIEISMVASVREA